MAGFNCQRTALIFPTKNPLLERNFLRLAKRRGSVGPLFVQNFVDKHKVSGIIANRKKVSSDTFFLSFSPRGKSK